MGKHEKERKRSKKKDKKDRKRRRSSSSGSSDSDEDTKFDISLVKNRAEKAHQRKLEKQRQKELETPEEKHARRLAKKLKKDEKKRRENDSYLPPQLQYTNTNNPFNDTKLTETFVWGKKLESEGRKTLSLKDIEKDTRRRVEKNVREMEELKRTRDARLAAREDMEMIQRDADRKAHGEWTEKEHKFQLEQAKVRSQLRIEQNRAKPIDLLSRYILFGDPVKVDEKTGKKPDDDFELDDPLGFIKGLTLNDYEDLIEDIKVYRTLEDDRHFIYWQDIRCLVDDEIKKLRGENSAGELTHGAVHNDVTKIFKGKSVDELSRLEKDITVKIRNGGPGVDISYWEGLLAHLKVFIARTRLRELHQKMLKLKLQRIREEQMKEVGKIEEDEKKIQKRPQPSTTIKDKPLSTAEAEDAETDELQKKVRRKVDLSELEDGELDDERKEHRWRQLAADQLEEVTLELYNRGCYSPTYGDVNDTMPGIEVLEEETDANHLEQRRQKHRKKPDGIPGADAAMLAIARKGMEGDEATFGVEQQLETQSYLWSDKYRPRKPTYLNRVQTGFDWNKYNQTHYDMDNPPPKIVQGYKFNLFYPDLLDKKKTPEFKVLSTDDPDFCVIRFSSGPPYEDIAFKCVNREWEISHKNGYKSQFQNGVFQLWFQFKKYRYRR